MNGIWQVLFQINYLLRAVESAQEIPCLCVSCYINMCFVILSTVMRSIDAVIFDMDGVLLDSETISDRTWLTVAQQTGVDNIEKLIADCRGQNARDTIAHLHECCGKLFDAESFIMRTTDLFYQIETTEGIPLMKGAKAALDCLSKKYRLALASSTDGVAVQRQLENAGLLSYFETRTTGNMVTHSKPDPEIYRMACASLGLQPNRCCAVEDSPNGIRSAHAAGLLCVMVPDKIQPDDEMRALADYIIPSLEKICDVL